MVDSGITKNRNRGLQTTKMCVLTQTEIQQYICVGTEVPSVELKITQKYLLTPF